MKIIDIDNWNRKEHFNFFSQYDEPFFGIVSEIDCSLAYKFVKKNNLSFFSYYLYKSLIAVNKIEEFRYRINNENVVIYDAIHASSTIGRKDGTFAFSFVEYNSDFGQFDHNLKKEIEAVQNSKGLRFDGGSIRNDIIHYSSLPWSKFTGLTHARHFKTVDSVPKITFGKIFERSGTSIMNISINAHHGLVDGLHVSKFLDLFQELMNEN